MKILITGATGFVGKATVPALLKRGHKVRCFVRETSDVSAFKNLGVDFFTGDLFSNEDLEKAMNGCDALIHLANVYSFWEPNPGIYDEVNINGTIQVMRAAAHSMIGHVVHVSTAVVYGNASPQPYNELTQYGNERFSQYADSKFYGEKFAEKYQDEAGLPLTILQPVSILGPADYKASGRQIENYVKKIYPAKGFLDTAITYVHLNDVVDAISRVLENPKTIGQRYLLGNESITNNDYLNMIEEISGVPLPKITLPDWLMIFIAQVFTVRANRKKKPPIWGLSIDMAKTFQAGFQVDGTRAERELGIQYTPVRKALRESIQWYVDQNKK